MTTYAYSPHTGEIILTEDVAEWMGTTEVAPPEYSPQTQSAFWRNDAWEIEEVRPEPQAVPQQVTRRQGRLALLQIGRLDEFEQAIEAITDPLQKRRAQVEYEADTWERGNEFLQSLWAQRGGTEQGLDNLFIVAAGL